MALVGYARVSTTDQSLDIQIEQLKAAGCKKIFSEKRTGTTIKDRTELDDCMNYLREDDVLIITKIDRLGRSTRDLHNLVHDLEEQGITLKVLDQGIDTNTDMGKMFFSFLAMFAELENKLRKERQLAGIEKAKERGVYKGRKPKIQALEPHINAMLASGMSKTEAPKTLGISLRSVYNALYKNQ